MFLEKIKLINFKNYEKLNLKFNKNINILYGNNAQGKTNLIESIYLLSKSYAHRVNENSVLIRHGCRKARVLITCVGNVTKKNYQIDIFDNKKIFTIDDNEVKKNGNYINESIDTILFTPDDLEIIKGSPNIRRTFMNEELCGLSNSYVKILNDYNKLLKIRNDYLKKIQLNKKIDDNYFDIVTKYLIEKSILIYKMRKKFVDKINIYSSNIFESISNLSDFKINYICNFFESSDNIAHDYEKILKDNLKKEIKNGSTLYGPHRDDLEFYLGNKDLKIYGSQGQQRISVLCLKLSEIEIYKTTKDKYPIILLDDIFSELDESKKNNLLNFLNNKYQVFITTTDLKKLKKQKIRNVSYFKIEKGNVLKMEEGNK